MKIFSIAPLFIIILILLFNCPILAAQFTQNDRDRLIRLETKVEEGQKSIQIQINDLKTSLQKQIDDIKSFLFWGFGILFGGMGILIGYVIWDRRTALEPVARRNKELAEKEDKLEKVIKEYAKSEPKLAEILRSVNL